MKRYILLFSFSLILLSACSNQKVQYLAPDETDEEENKSITVYYPSDDISEIAVMEDLCRSFAEQYPDIDVQMEPSVKGIYTENLKIKETVGEMPDIFQIQNPDSFVKADIVGEMPGRVGELVKNPVMIDQKTYAVPIYTKTYGIIYNKVLFNNYHLEVPKTYDEFIHICEVFKKSGIAPIALGGSKTDQLSYWFNYFYQIDVVKNNNNWQTQRNNKQISFSDEPAYTLLNHYVSLLNGQYTLEDSINMNDNQLIDNFVEGNAAMIYAGPWFFSQIVAQDAKATDFYEPSKDRQHPKEEFRLGWFFMPDREGNPVAMEITAMNWAMSKECLNDIEKKEAATLFLEFFYQKANYRKVLQAVNGLPTTKEAVLYPMIGAQQKLMVSYRYADKSRNYIGNNQTPEGFLTTLYPTLDSLITGTISLETATERLDEEWDALQEAQSE